MCQQCDSVIFTHHHPIFRYHDDFTTLCIASGMPAEIKRFILSRRDASSLKRVKHKLDMDERRVPPIIPWHTHARTHPRTSFFFFYFILFREARLRITADFGWSRARREQTRARFTWTESVKVRGRSPGGLSLSFGFFKTVGGV